MRIPSGITDQFIYFKAVDSTDLKTPETGLSSFTVYRSRNGGVASAFTTPTINETDSTNMPGVYELLLDEDMTIDAGDDSQEVVLHITHAGMAPVTRIYELYRPKFTAGSTLALADVADSVWDEALSGHLTVGTAGQRLVQIRANTAQAGAAGTITLDASASSTDDLYNGALIHITAGTGAGQARVITDYVGSTKVASVDTNWTTNPSSDSVFQILPGGGASISGTVDANVTDIDSAALAQINTEVDTAIADAATAMLGAITP